MKAATKLSERNANVLFLANGTRWRVEPADLPIVESWKSFDDVETNGLWKDATVTNLRRAQTVSATRLERGEE